MKTIILILLTIILLWVFTVKKYGDNLWFIIIERVLCISIALLFMLGGYIYYFLF